MNAPEALPRGPYPTAVWPEGLKHLPKSADKITHVYTLRPYVQPKPENVVTVTMEGVTHTVALDQDANLPGGFWIDAVLIGGKWHSAVDTLTDVFIRALESQVREDFAYEANAAGGMPQGVVMP